jgi:branched-subunit amino acid aminotransferase/4-amino-4-deoxychorismate lyase
MKLPLITKKDFFTKGGNQSRPWQKDYLAMYSTQWGGIVRDPDLMLVPVDDHLVHRGDGVFDVMRCVHGKIYQMEEHLQRLNRSAKAISLSFPSDYESVRDIIKDLLIAGGEKDCLIRVVLSRGPGSFTPNPYDCPSSQMYVNTVRFRGLPDDYYREGIRLISSHIPVKKSFFANVKSCNYLPNALMKMEAIEAGCQYSVSLDEDGFLAEGSTENIGVLTKDEVLRFPGFERTLSGITINRVFRLAEELVKENIIKDMRFARISPQEAYQAREMFLTGTTLSVLPVVSYDGRRIGNGSPGPAYYKLSSLMWEDMTENRELLTDINWKSGA